VDEREMAVMARLIRGRRWAALGTCAGEAPLASMVAYVPEPGFSGFLMLLSRLSLHTRHLLGNPRASLAIGAPDTGRGNPQTLPRISIQGRVFPVDRSDPRYFELHDLYVGRLPAQAPLFEMVDFILFRLVPEEARFVGGFARAFTVGPSELGEASALAA
jgi:putative heme iron utilization protein